MAMLILISTEQMLHPVSLQHQMRRIVKVNTKFSNVQG